MSEKDKGNSEIRVLYSAPSQQQLMTTNRWLVRAIVFFMAVIFVTGFLLLPSEDFLINYKKVTAAEVADKISTPALSAEVTALKGQFVQNFPLTHLSVVPTQLYRLLADNKSTALLQAMKAVLLGGSSAPKSLIEEAVRQHIPLYLSYGSTEMSSQIATTPAPIHGIQENSGRLLPWRELKVSQDGELLVRGACLFQGYLRAGTIQPQTDNDGWFHTSDIGTVTDDGTVTVAGRKDNMFISGGENIHPEEIETALMMIDGILDAIVVPVNDDEYGQRPVAFIKTAEENNPDEATLSKAMHSMTGKLKSPTHYYRVEEWATLPGSQKIDRGFYKKLSLLPPDA
jgi:O-succinylbenzoic acid--CoA ligase